MHTQKSQQLEKTSKDGLASQKQEAANKLPAKQRSIVLAASSSAPFKTMEPEHQAKAIISAIVKSAIICNAAPPNLDNEHEAAVFDMTIKLVAKHFGDLTEHEIVEAFEINVLGEEWEKVKPYQGMTFELCAEILRNYRRVRAHAIAKLNQAVQEQEQLKRIEESKVTDQEQYEFILDYYQKHKSWPIANYTAAFKHLWNTNNYQKKEYEQWFNDTKEHIKKHHEQKLSLAYSRVDYNEIQQSMTEDYIMGEIRKSFVKSEIFKNLNKL